MSHEDGGRKNKKFGGVCNGYPKGSNKLIKNNVQKICSVENISPGWLGPFFNHSMP